MERSELISFIKANDSFYADAILVAYSEEQLSIIRDRILRRKSTENGQKCPVCNGSGTVLNIGCASCNGSGTLKQAVHS